MKIKKKDNIDNTIGNQTENTQESIQEETQNQEISDNTQTQVVTQNPLTDNYNSEYQGVKIKNETSFELTSDILSQRIEVNKDNIVIFHTHTCESYTSSENYQYQP